MKVALINLPMDTNIGGNLQRYALCHILQEIGIDIIHIQIRFAYRLPNWKKPYVYAKRALLHFLHKKNESIYYEEELRKLYEESLNSILPFYNKYIPHSKPAYTLKEIKKMIGGCDAAIVGSDQVWRKTIASKLLPVMLLGDLPKAMPRYAYSVSFGVGNNELNEKEIKRFRDCYSKFRMVSVREHSGISILSKMSCLKPTPIHLLDPTFLLSKAHYEEMALSNRTIKEVSGDMICYILDSSEYKTRTIERLSKEKDMTFYKISLTSNICIEQWLYSFCKAKYIVTDSYHGMVFALIFNKPYYVFENDYRGNERFNSLMETFGVSLCEESPNWQRINQIIKDERTKALNYILEMKQSILSEMRR